MIEDLTQKERNYSLSQIKNFHGLNFKYYDENKSSYIFKFVDRQFKILFDPNSRQSTRDRHKFSNLHKWNIEISVKMIHLKDTFIYLSIYFNRFKLSNYFKDNQHFKYFAEVFAYFFISVSDIILQLINSFFYSPIKEEYLVNFKNIKDILNDKNNSILESINTFENNTNVFRKNIRNAFSHRTNPLHHYYITTLKNDDHLKVSPKKNTNDTELYELIIVNMKYLSDFIEELREKMQ